MIAAKFYRTPKCSVLLVCLGSTELAFRFAHAAPVQYAALSPLKRSLGHRDGLERLAAKLDRAFLAVVGQIPADVRRPNAW